MPITVKFSKGFYDQLGHEVVDELVDHMNAVDTAYRTVLGDLNEANFARLESLIAKSETRIIRWMFTFWAPTAIAVVAILIRG
jgi:hypothetical protein